jgi:hypothetical protein
MTTIIPLSTAIFSARLAVSTPRYAQIVGYAEPAFFGISHPDNKAYECREIWSHDQRIAIYRALQEAQSEVEKTAEYPLMPTWFAGERHPFGINPITLKYGKLIQMGQLATTTWAGQAMDITNDPAVVTVAGVTFTDINEVHIYHPGTTIEIYPSEITIVAGVLTIKIPFVRAVEIAHENNPPEGWDYADHANWVEDTVDVKREYLSATLPAVEFVSYDCECNCPAPQITDGCAVVKDYEMSIINVGTVGGCLPCKPRYTDLYYQAGETVMTPQAEDIIVRLAHARMPNEPCGCDWLKARWRGDQLVPEVLTAERENCPYGLSQGAWQAYIYAQAIKQIRMGVI